ncbi:zincin, partial [Lentinus tigrinus ALCF2SS1-7]|uniref:zincin n=1 Tax=Lentinus tigrinus ALCF2SS1-7 TaxID=1328758 RepID=UPI0011663DF7
PTGRTVASEHVDFDWTIDFAKQAISGSVTHLLRLKKDDVKEVIFDTVALDVTKVIVEDRPGNDSSSVKITYAAKVASVLPVLLSAIRVSPPSDGPAHGGKEIGKDVVTYEYKQPVPIPTYLVAIAVGNFRYRALPKVEGKEWSTGVWAEPELIDAAYWEFSEATGKFLATAETILPPYRFGVYDLLVLRRSPLLVGDRTLVDVVVHELTHSWFGNGVTQANSTHFWLNEGWTVYMERLMLQLLYTPAARGFDAVALEVTKVIIEDRPGNVGDQICVQIFYSTTKDCTAVQWLDKGQTQGKTFPFMFSQAQPIYARSLAPLRDWSSVKITYNAKVACVLPVLLSAIRVSPPSDGPAHDGKEIGKDVVTYEYKQPVPIPPYLIAIAIGNFRYRALPKVEGKEWSTGIWAEPELIDAAYWEFSEDTGRFLATAEKILRPYRFGVYDLLVLPPSFPYGGMENACLTSLTPTLLTGDAHLQANSTHFWLNEGWTTYIERLLLQLLHTPADRGFSFLIGYKSLQDTLKQQANSTHFWLNEGWTVYMERLMLQLLYTPAARGFSFLIGFKALQDSLKGYVDRPRYQRLVIDFEPGEDPDDAYSRVPYEKGANFLLRLERMLGGLDVFLPYVYDYSITTEQWKAHLYAYFEKHGGEEKVKALDSVKWNEWLYGEGLKLPVEMVYDTALAREAFSLAEKWDASRSEADSYAALPTSHIKHLGEVYSFLSTPNAELRWRFYEVALLDPASPAAKEFAPEAARWVTGTDGSGILRGRMKFCRPTFRAIARVDRTLAVEVFGANREAFHPIVRRLIEKPLHLEKDLLGGVPCTRQSDNHIEAVTELEVYSSTA